MLSVAVLFFVSHFIIYETSINNNEYDNRKNIKFIILDSVSESEYTYRT